MRNRIIERITSARREGKKLLCVYITLGFPSVKASEKLIAGLDRAGVDILELGFPFSDPLADGPVIQRASHDALKHLITLETACRVVEKARRRGVRFPIIFFSYLNPILRYGISRFAKRIYDAGFDGVIIPDLPPDEDPSIIRQIRKARLLFINLVAPTTLKQRLKLMVHSSQGFIYYVSRRGVTGVQQKFENRLDINLKHVQSITKKPVLVGFGITTPAQARHVARLGGGAVVGSALISSIRKSKGRLLPALREAERLAQAVHAVKSGRGTSGSTRLKLPVGNFNRAHHSTERTIKIK